MYIISYFLSKYITKFRFWLKDRKNIKRKPLFQSLAPKAAIMILIAGIIAAIITTLILNGLNIVFNGAGFMEEYAKNITDYNIIENKNIKQLSTLFLLYVIIDPFIEEFIFRYIVTSIFDKLLNLKLYTIIGSSMVFAVLHDGIVQQVYAFIFGLILVMLYFYDSSYIKAIKTKEFKKINNGLNVLENRNLFRSYLFHLGFNLVGFVIATII